jgi:DNA-repair protein XRCC1
LIFITFAAEPSRPSKEKAFSDLLKDVVFVLSGYQNPERGKIRDKAMEMGATYKPDWGKGCTHLM